MNDYGYTTSVVAKLVQVEATTSLAYRPLVEAEELGVSERGYFLFCTQTHDLLMQEAWLQFYLFLHKMFCITTSLR